jgi:hypothetical protein
MVSQSVCLGVEHPCGTCDQILLPVGILRCCFCGASSLTRGRVCNLQCNHAMVRVAQNPKPYFTVSFETPPQPGGPGSCIYIPQEQGDPVIPPATGFPLPRLLRLAGLRRYSNHLPTWRARSPYIYPSGTTWSSSKSK